MFAWESRLLDGELVNGKLLNRAIGLFETNRLFEQLKANETNFTPNRVFWTGKCRLKNPTRDGLSEFICNEYVQSLIDREISSPEHTLNKLKEDGTLLNLCPVTRSLLLRYMNRQRIHVESISEKRPKVFVSYKWQDEFRNEWVKRFSSDLSQRFCIDVQLDVYKIGLGESITHYMASNVGKECDAFLFVITPASVAAVNQGTGSLSFEMQLATARRLTDPTFKVIGVFREGDENAFLLGDGKYIDFRDSSRYYAHLDELAKQLKAIHCQRTAQQIVADRI